MKKNIPIIISIFILAFLISAGAFKLNQKTDNQLQFKLEAKYENPDYGLSFSYPKEWTISTYQENSVIIFEENNLEILSIYKTTPEENIKSIEDFKKYLDNSCTDETCENYQSMIKEINNKKVIISKESNELLSPFSKYLILYFKDSYLIQIIGKNNTLFEQIFNTISIK